MIHNLWNMVYINSTVTIYLCNIRWVRFIYEQIISDFKNIFFVISIISFTVLYFDSEDLCDLNTYTVLLNAMDLRPKFLSKLWILDADWTEP